MVVIETLVDHRVRRGKKKGDAGDKSGDVVVEYLVQYSKAEGQAKGDKVWVSRDKLRESEEGVKFLGRYESYHKDLKHLPPPTVLAPSTQQPGAVSPPSTVDLTGGPSPPLSPVSAASTSPTASPTGTEGKEGTNDKGGDRDMMAGSKSRSSSSDPKIQEAAADKKAREDAAAQRARELQEEERRVVAAREKEKAAAMQEREERDKKRELERQEKLKQEEAERRLNEVRIEAEKKVAAAMELKRVEKAKEEIRKAEQALKEKQAMEEMTRKREQERREREDRERERRAEEQRVERMKQREKDRKDLERKVMDAHMEVMREIEEEKKKQLKKAAGALVGDATKQGVDNVAYGGNGDNGGGDSNVAKGALLNRSPEHHDVGNVNAFSGGNDDRGMQSSSVTEETLHSTKVPLSLKQSTYDDISLEIPLPSFIVAREKELDDIFSELIMAKGGSLHVKELIFATIANKKIDAIFKAVPKSRQKTMERIYSFAAGNSSGSITQYDFHQLFSAVKNEPPLPSIDAGSHSSSTTTDPFPTSPKAKIEIKAPQSADAFQTILKERMQAAINPRILMLDSLQMLVFPYEITKMANLVELNLSYNRLQIIPDDILYFKSLERLYLASNALQLLPSGIGEMKSLQVLDISDNQFAKIDSVSSCQELRYLNISGNKIKSLPVSLSTLLKLDELILYGNPWDDEKVVAMVATEGIAYLYSVLVHQSGDTKNHVQGTSTNKVFETIFTSLRSKMVKIRYTSAESSLQLQLGALKLSFLPEPISSLSQLESLIIDNNPLMTLPTGVIVYLKHLIVLKLTRCSLKVLPDELCHVSKLISLDVSNNALTKLPLDIGSLTQLESFDCSNNTLKMIPRSIAKLTHLKFLKISGNPLYDMDKLDKALNNPSFSAGYNIDQFQSLLGGGR